MARSASPAWPSMDRRVSFLLPRTGRRRSRRGCRRRGSARRACTRLRPAAAGGLLGRCTARRLRCCSFTSNLAGDVIHARAIAMGKRGAWFDHELRRSALIDRPRQIHQPLHPRTIVRSRRELRQRTRLRSRSRSPSRSHGGPRRKTPRASGIGLNRFFHHFPLRTVKTLPAHDDFPDDPLLPRRSYGSSR